MGIARVIMWVIEVINLLTKFPVTLHVVSESRALAEFFSLRLTGVPSLCIVSWKSCVHSCLARLRQNFMLSNVGSPKLVWRVGDRCN